MPNDLPSLRISFESPEIFQREFDSNLTNGGAFVRTEENFALRQAVDVELCFEYSGQTLTLRAEVVHIIPPEMAGGGSAPGVAVQFQMPVRDLRDQLGALAVAAPESAGNVDSGQRSSPRKPVRVAAQIQGDREVVSGHTRNLSLTGVLIGVGGQSVALGEAVSVMLEHPSTPKATLTRARKIALSNGVRYAYTGNIHDADGDTTNCHACGTALIGREWYDLKLWNLGEGGTCPSCGAPCSGRFETHPGDWGRKRQPVRLADYEAAS